jgi:hypothetical protein
MRIRGDKQVQESHRVDWTEFAATSRNRKLVFADGRRSLMNGYGFIMADQYACGAREPMGVYANTFDMTETARNKPGTLYRFPTEHVPHENVAFATFYGGVRAVVQPGIIFGRMLNPGLIPADVVLQALEKDIAGRTANLLDEEFLAACREDIESEVRGC